MKKRVLTGYVIFLLVVTMILPGCTGDLPVEPVEQPEGYHYPGEEKTMAWKNPAYNKEEYAEGADLFVWVNNKNDTSREYSYSGTVHWVENQGNHIFSLLCLPKDYDETQQYPLLLMVHGYNSNYHEYDYFTNYLTEAGYAVLYFDFRGGHESNTLSDGRLSQMSYDTKLSDLRAMVDFAETLPMLDQDHFIFVGHSQGGMMGAITACTEGLRDRFVGMLLLAPGIRHVTYLDEFGSLDNLPEAYTILYATVGRDFLYSAIKYDQVVWDGMKDYEYPVKILLGTKDELNKEESIQEITASFGENASYEMVEGGYHDFRDDVLPWLMPETILPYLDSLIN